MSPFEILVTFGAGLVMGAINNVAGGAGVLALMAFTYACGLPLATANPSLRPAAIAVGLFGFLGFLRAGLKIPARAWGQALMAVPGAPIGSWLALWLPDIVFRLYLVAVLGLLLWQQLRTQPIASSAGPRPFWVGAVGCLLVGVHMGYAQIAVGLLATLVLAASYERDLVAVNAAKSTLVITTAVASVGTFAFTDAIAWGPAMALFAGCAIGSYAASHWSVQKGSSSVRRVVIVLAALTLVDQLVNVALLLLRD